MSKFSYLEAYLDSSSQELFKNLGVMKDELHMTTCFDSSATISSEHNINLPKMKAKVKCIKHWNTINGVMLVAELKDCDWSQEFNKYFHLIGAKEDLPHLPHITLEKGENLELMKALKVLEGSEITFDKHIVKNKFNNTPSMKMKIS